MAPVKITSKKDGFRRCGQEHTGCKTWPDGTFTPAQIALLERDPMLVVEVLPKAPAAPKAPAPSDDSGEKKEAGK